MISVIIPTFNRWPYLERCLSALEKQTLSSKDFEVVVVDDESTDQTASCVQKLASKVRFSLRVVNGDHKGPGQARNKGVAAARGELIAFVDDDCEPTAGWLEAYQAAFVDSNVVWAGGPTKTIEQDVTPMTHQIVTTGMTPSPTCNLAVRKRVFDEIGGFDSAFLFSNEDGYLSFSLQDQGYRYTYVSGAIMIHPPRPLNFWKDVRRTQYLDSEFILAARLPKVYRLNRGSPWRAVFYYHLIRHYGSQLRDAFKGAPRHPWLALEAICLCTFQRLYLIWLLPGFIARALIGEYQKTNRL